MNMDGKKINKKVLIVGGVDSISSELYLRTIGKFGDDVVIVNVDDAIKHNLNTDEIISKQTIDDIKFPKLAELKHVSYNEYKSGREKRRDRRKKQRNNKKF